MSRFVNGLVNVVLGVCLFIQVIAVFATHGAESAAHLAVAVGLGVWLEVRP